MAWLLPLIWVVTTAQKDHMRTIIPSTVLMLSALGLYSLPGGAQDPYTVDPYAVDGYPEQAYDTDQHVVEDSLEARVWLDRGADAVVDRGDEVRVYYRTSHDAFAAIFRIDTDGRIELVYPQHPDADPWVVGGRDYRLVFPEGARWKVREDPGVGYFFIVASYQPLDFSLFGYDDDRGWDLRGVGETVYEDPYVAIDDYVAAVLPDWETAGYALDFLEYSVDEAHDYPRFLCYDCHDYRPYSSWDPYARACSSFQVVIWDDPYFYPRFRYVGTRVVFARPIGPRPRYSVTARLVGSGPRPIVRSRPAPPRRTAVYKEAPRRTSTIVPRRGASPSGRAVAPSRIGAGSPAGRGVAPSRTRAVSPSGRGAASARPSPGATRRDPPLPSARRGIPPAVRGTPAAGSSSTARDRPTLQRRPPTRSPAAGSGRAAPARPPGAQPRATPSRPPRSEPRATPSRPPRAQPRAKPSRPPRAQPRVTPSRPPRTRPQATPSRPPPSGPRTAPARSPRSGARAGPTRPPRSGAGGAATPARSPRATGSATPSRPPRANARAAPSRRPPGAAASGSAGSRSRTEARPTRRPGG